MPLNYNNRFCFLCQRKSSLYKPFQKLLEILVGQGDRWRETAADEFVSEDFEMLSNAAAAVPRQQVLQLLFRSWCVDKELDKSCHIDTIENR
jgi:hypothetical protein|tara:strand:+ start:289 stop:564 length:276 start_codon:yes stop_codon:yes gene_type:complete